MKCGITMERDTLKKFIMKDPIGAQIWSLKTLMQTRPEMTLERLSLAGYTFIEPAGFNFEQGTIQGFAPRMLKNLAGYQGLKIHSAHFSFQPEDTHAVCECAAELGLEYIVLPFLRKELQQNSDTYKQAADELNEAGEIAAMYRLRLAYHNHAHEFQSVGGPQIPFDILLTHTAPELVVFQADLGWMVAAGVLPQDYFVRYPGRFLLWHLRDIEHSTKNPTILGKGSVPFPDIFSEKEKAGLRYAIVEMSSAAENPLEQLEQSLSGLRF